MTYDVIVIGAGVNGLVAAAYLARAGKKVLVLEERAEPGGLCATEEFHPGYRANTCVDDAGWVPPVVARDLNLASLGYEPQWSPVSMIAAVEDGASLRISGNVASTAEGLRARSSRDGAKWEGFCSLVARLSGFLEVLYTRRTPIVESNAPADLMALLSLGGKLRGLGKRGIIDLLRTVPMPIADVLDERFESPVLKGALAYDGVAQVQHGPESGGTALVFLNRHVGAPLGQVGGMRSVKGGIGALPAALVRAATAAGVTIRSASAVAEILVRDDRVTGVRLASGEEIQAAQVASSADVRRTFGLLEPGWFDPDLLHAVDHVRMRGSTARVHLALSGLPTFRSGGAVWSAADLRGRIMLSPSMRALERSYDDAKHRRLPASPVCWATIPTVHDDTLAPAGHHVMSVQVQFAAHDVAGGWTNEAKAALGEAVMSQLARVAPDLPDRVLHREVLTPVDIERRFGATQGSLLHGELALDQFLFMRPVPEYARYTGSLTGLWLCGSGTHPGAGSAGASGYLAAREMLSRRPR